MDVYDTPVGNHWFNALAAVYTGCSDAHFLAHRHS